MNLYTIKEVKRPTSPDQITEWRDGYAWLAGGTWLFSEPQINTDTLIDLDSFGWKALESSAGGLDLAATCRIVELNAFKPPAAWKAGSLIHECCQAYLASWKIWNAASIGGILHVATAGPMIADGCTRSNLYPLARDGNARSETIDFVTGDHRACSLGRAAAQHSLPAEALSKRCVPALVAHPSGSLGGCSSSARAGTAARSC